MSGVLNPQVPDYEESGDMPLEHFRVYFAYTLHVYFRVRTLQD